MRNRLKDGWIARDEILKMIPKPTQDEERRETDAPFGSECREDLSPLASLEMPLKHIKETHKDFFERLDSIIDELGMLSNRQNLLRKNGDLLPMSFDLLARDLDLFSESVGDVLESLNAVRECVEEIRKGVQLLLDL